MNPPPSTINHRRLLATAIKAATRSYSPYSHFPVGAALLMQSGKIISGCNVENASYGLTLCAERTTIATAVAAGHRHFKALAVVGGRGKAARPCGACLQVLAEFCTPGLPVYLAPLNKPDKVERTTLGALLPQSFHLHTPSR